MSNLPKEVFVLRPRTARKMEEYFACGAAIVNLNLQPGETRRVGRYVLQEELDATCKVEAKPVQPKKRSKP